MLLLATAVKIPWI